MVGKEGEKNSKQKNSGFKKKKTVSHHYIQNSANSPPNMHIINDKREMIAFTTLSGELSLGRRENKWILEVVASVDKGASKEAMSKSQNIQDVQR